LKAQLSRSVPEIIALPRVQPVLLEIQTSSHIMKPYPIHLLAALIALSGAMSARAQDRPITEPNQLDPHIQQPVPQAIANGAVSNQVPPFTNLPPFTNQLPPFTNRLPPFTNRLPPFTNRLPPFTNRIPPITNRVPGTLNGPPPWTNGVPNSPPLMTATGTVPANPLPAQPPTAPVRPGVPTAPSTPR
jgi:hypothetical protein